jgi:hypothetical protein
MVDPALSGQQLVGETVGKTRQHPDGLIRRAKERSVISDRDEVNEKWEAEWRGKSDGGRNGL